MVRADIAEALSQDSTVGLGSLSDAQIQDIRRVAAERAADIRRRSAVAGDQAALFAQVSALAKAHGVQIDQLQPVVDSAAQARAAQAVTTPSSAQQFPAAASTPPQHVQVGCSMSVQASYSDLAAFLNSLRNRLGYTVVTDLRIQPGSERDPGRLSATIQTTHHGFDVSAVKLPPPPPTVQSADAPADTLE